MTRGHSGKAPPGPDASAEALYVEHQRLIDDTIRAVCRRRRLPPDEAEGFASRVRLRLVESNYEVLRRFEGRASLQTYLTVVIQRLFLDFRDSKWGKWRPSVVGRSAGQVGIRLEQLVVRDGLPVDAAVLRLRSEGFAEPADDVLLALAARFPIRQRRHYVGDEVLEFVAARDADVESMLIREELGVRFERVKERVRQLIEALPTQERLILQLRFEQGLTVAQVARALALDQKRLYRTFDKVLSRLRSHLQAEGIDARDVALSMDDPPVPLTADPKAMVRVRPYQETQR